MKIRFYLLAETLNRCVVKVTRKPLHLVIGLHIRIACALTKISNKRFAESFSNYYHRKSYISFGNVSITNAQIYS